MSSSSNQRPLTEDEEDLIPADYYDPYFSLDNTKVSRHLERQERI